LSLRRAQVALALVALVAALAIVEASLRTFVDALPLALANDLASGYNARRSGIYRFQPDMDMFLMRPHYEREMFFNGYHWHHRTDWMGFRNPEDRRSADVVLLGDSMVYGHGLEEPSTIRHHLEALIGRNVANLGIQGAGIHEEYQVLKRFGLPLEPRFVFLFFLENDIDDLVQLHTDDEMRRFLATAVDDHRTPYFDVVPPSDGWLHRWKGAVGDLYTVRACRFLVRWLSPGGATAAETDVPRWASLPLFRQRGVRQVLAMRFHLHALAKMQDLARQGHFTFVNVFIWTGHFAEEPIYEGILKSYCREQGIAFLDLREAEREVNDRERLFLPVDGHFSDAGTRWVAELLAKSMTG
jgi:lysophospholipase L1-like esterase